MTVNSPLEQTGTRETAEDSAGAGAAPPAGERLKITIPTGHMKDSVLELLSSIGLKFSSSGRSYRPVCNDPVVEAKLLKAQNIPGLVALGRHDCGFSGSDWIAEQGADVVELLDLELDPVSIVAAVPESLKELFEEGAVPERRLVVASEYRAIAEKYIKERGLNAIFVQAYGATEALPPEDADMVVDNTATGTTLRHNRLAIVDELMRSTTRFVCNREALSVPWKRRRLEELTMLMRSAIQARGKVMLEMNVSETDFQKVVQDLPCMRAPTVSQLYNGDGYAIKVAVPASEVPSLIPKLVSLGARDILEYRVEKIVG